MCIFWSFGYKQSIGGTDKTAYPLQDVVLLFALTAAMFDASIICWKTKYVNNSPRPITAVNVIYGKELVRHAHLHLSWPYSSNSSFGRMCTCYSQSAGCCEHIYTVHSFEVIDSKRTSWLVCLSEQSNICWSSTEDLAPRLQLEFIKSRILPRAFANQGIFIGAQP